MDDAILTTLNWKIKWYYYLFWFNKIVFYAMITWLILNLLESDWHGLVWNCVSIALAWWAMSSALHEYYEAKALKLLVENGTWL